MKTFIFWLRFSVVSSPIVFALAVVVIVGFLIATRKVSRSHRSAWRAGIILLTVAVLSAVSAWKIHRFNSHVVDPQAYQAVEAGMTKQQVVNLLGAPSAKDLSTWRYDKPGIWEYAVIYFDGDGKVKQKFLDR